MIYLVLAAVGTAASWYFWWASGFDLPIVDTLGNYAAAAQSADLLVVSAITLVFILEEARRANMRLRWGYVALGVLVGQAGALGVFLYMRERAMRRPHTGARTV